MTAQLPSVYLMNPPITREQRGGRLGPVIKNLYFNSPPLGLAYIAAMLERAGAGVRLTDAAVEDYSMQEAIEQIGSFGPDIVGITSTTNFFCNALELASAVKRRFPDITTVLGGPHVSSHTASAMANTCFDFACVGEGEITAVELARALAAGSRLDDVQGIAFRRGTEVVQSPARPLIENLDTLPMPARHLLPLHKYVPQPNDGPYLPKAAMISSRGCPYRCIFCDHGIYGNTYRSFSPGRIVDEMSELVNRYGMRDIAFVDSLFMISAQRVDEITDEILRRGLAVRWTCTMRANITTREILEKMKSAGCWRVRIGVEAGNDEVLKLIRKDVTKQQVRRAVRDADRSGLRPKGFFMIGHPGETRERILESITFARSLPLTDITVQINTPLPGAPQWSMISDHGELVTRDLDKYSFWEPVFVPRGMTADELQELHRRFYRDFYFRPAVIRRHLSMVRTFADVGRYARALSLMINMFVRKRRKLPNAERGTGNAEGGTGNVNCAEQGVFRPLEDRDTAWAARQHAALMENSVFAIFGAPFLEQVYRHFAGSRHSVSYVYEENGESMAVIASTSNRRAFMRGLLLRSGLKLALISVAAAVRSGACRRLLRRMPAYLRKTCRNETNAEMIFITVARDCRKAGLGRTLIQMTLDEFQRRGVRDVNVSIESENTPVKNLLLGLGFEVIDQFMFPDKPNDLLATSLGGTTQSSGCDAAIPAEQ